MESNQVTPADDDDFYPMNDEETSDYYVEDDTEPSQNQEGVPAPDINANMDLFRYQENLFKEISSKKTAPSRYDLGTGSYFDYHFNKFSLKFQERIDENETAFNVFFALQEFIKAFKNCKTEDADIRAAGLTGYLAQIKEDVNREYQQTGEKSLKAAKIVEYNEIIGFLESALLWRIEHYTTDFPDIQEKDIAQELLELEGNIKVQYGSLAKTAENRKEDLEKILQKLKEMKICPLWHQKVCKRLELRQEVLRLLDKLKKGDSSKKETPGGTKTGEKYKGEVSDKVFEEINKRRVKVTEEKNRIIIDKTEYKVSDSFDIPSSYILEGTYFDQKLKEKSKELEAFSLKYWDLPIIKALNQIIEVVNLMFNTPLEPFFFVCNLKDLMALLKDQQVEIQNSEEDSEIANDILVFIMRLVDILEDVLEWKEDTKLTHGDVKNSEADVLLKSVEMYVPRYEEYMINVTRLLVYMTTREYGKETKVLKEERWKLLKVRLAVNNVECVEKFDDLLMKVEGIIEGLKQVYEAKNKNYQALKGIYEDHKYKIDKGIYDVKTRAENAYKFEALVEDFDIRFGSEIAYGTRKSVLYWVKEIKLLQLGKGGQDSGKSLGKEIKKIAFE